MNVLKEGSGQPGLVESGRLLETWKLNLALKYGYTSHPSTQSLTGSIFSYTLKNQGWISKQSQLDWTVRMVRWAGTWLWRVLYSWLSSLGWPKRSFAVSANQPITLNRQALDSNKLQALPQLPWQPGFTAMDGIEWLTDSWCLGSVPTPLKSLAYTWSWDSQHPPPEFVLILTFHLYHWKQPQPERRKRCDNVKITPRTTLSSLSPTDIMWQEENGLWTQTLVQSHSTIYLLYRFGQVTETT